MISIPYKHISIMKCVYEGRKSAPSTLQVNLRGNQIHSVCVKLYGWYAGRVPAKEAKAREDGANTTSAGKQRTVTLRATKHIRA